MGVTTRSQASSDHEKWEKIFNGLVKMLKSQQEQLETFVKERKILEDRLKMQHEKWISDVRLLEDHISQMKSDLVAQERNRLLEAAKSNMMSGLKHREAYLLKVKLEHSTDELADFRTWFDLHRDNLIDGGSRSVGSKLLEGEVKRLKLEYDKLASEKSSEVSTLLAEKSFVWNQYKLMENDLTDKLNRKRAEVDQANEKIAQLLARMERLQSSNNDKDEIIASLRTKASQMEASTSKLNDEISVLSRELELLRKTKNAFDTPLLNRCTTGCRSSNKGGKKGRLDGTNVVVKKEFSRTTRSASVTSASGRVVAGARTSQMKNSVTNGSKVSVKKESPTTYVLDLEDKEKGSRSMKRKVFEPIPIPDSPKLFSTGFKVPKLKIPSSQVG